MSCLWGSSKMPRPKTQQAKQPLLPSMLPRPTGMWRTSGSSPHPIQHKEGSSRRLPEPCDGAWLLSSDSGAREASRRVGSLAEVVASTPPDSAGRENWLLRAPTLKEGDIPPWSKTWNDAITRCLEPPPTVSGWRGESARTWNRPPYGQIKLGVETESMCRTTLLGLRLSGPVLGHRGGGKRHPSVSARTSHPSKIGNVPHPPHVA